MGFSGCQPSEGRVWERLFNLPSQLWFVVFLPTTLGSKFLFGWLSIDLAADFSTE
jgi:hypothetical protein